MRIRGETDDRADIHFAKEHADELHIDNNSVPRFDHWKDIRDINFVPKRLACGPYIGAMIVFTNGLSTLSISARALIWVRLVQ